MNLSRTDLTIKNHPIKTYCVSCGRFIKNQIVSMIFDLKYNDFCKLSGNLPKECKKCAARNNYYRGEEKSKRTCIERYGVEYSFQSENNRRKTIETKLKKYGPDWKKIQVKCMFNNWARDENGKLINHNRK